MCFEKWDLPKHIFRPNILVQAKNYGLQEDVLESDACERGEDGLSGEVAGAEIGCGEGQNLEGETFRFDHYEAGDGEADHWEPVV